MVQAATDPATSVVFKNVAIIIAVSDYDNAQGLPACKIDGQLMAAIIKHSGKFSDDDVLVVATDTTSKNIKTQLATFIGKRLGSPIGDLFFYFSGHGDYNDQDFNFVLSNYNPAKRNQTSLSNTELDTMLRSLSPQVAVKVVDACNSGVQYIKDMDVFKRYVESTTKGFRNCYFLFSSQRDQSSFAHKLSDFTEAIAEAMLEHPEEIIRYKDIIDVVSDKFENGALPQTPCFTTQATFTEPFCNISDNLRNAIKAILNPSITAPAGVVGITVQVQPAKSIKDVLLDRIREQASNYCTLEEAKCAFELLANTFTNACTSDELGELYSFNTELLGNLNTIPEIEVIAKNLEQANEDFFVQLVYGPTFGGSNLSGLMSGLTSTGWQNMPQGALPLSPTLDLTAEIPLTTTTTTPPPSQFSNARKFLGLTYQKPAVPSPTSFATSPPATYRAIKIIAEPSPSFPNIPAWTAFIVPVSSKVTLRLFNTVIRQADLNWSQRRHADPPRWMYQDVPLKRYDEVSAAAEQLMRDLQFDILHYLLQTHGMVKPPSATDDKPSTPDANVPPEHPTADITPQDLG